MNNSQPYIHLRTQSSYSLSERVRAFIKIQDGCSYNCSYCTIPAARGLSRSFNIENTIKAENNKRAIEIINTNGKKEILMLFAIRPLEELK